MGHCIFVNLNIKHYNINNNKNTKSNNKINIIENLFKTLINHYNQNITSLININNNKEGKTNENISIVEKSIYT